MTSVPGAHENEGTVSPPMALAKTAYEPPGTVSVAIVFTCAASGSDTGPATDRP